MINPTLKKILNICGIVALCVAAIAAAVFLQILFDTYLGMAIDMLRKFFLAKNASEGVAIALSFLVVIAALIVLPFACYLIHKVNSAFTKKIESSYESFKNTNLSDNKNMFLEIYNDPTISLKDKMLFCAIYAIYCIQRPFLYCASKVSLVNQWMFNVIFSGHGRGGNGILVCAALTLLNAIILAPVALLELIKYPLIKLFSPLGLNVAQLSFLFDVSDVDSDSQSVHTPSFERSVVQCVQELNTKYKTQPNVLDEEFENYINNSEELKTEQKDLLRSYLNFNQPNVNNSNVNYYNWRTWRESKTELTLTQTVNLVLTAARDQKLDMDLLKCMILIRLNEGNGKCPLGMFNRIVYSLSCLEAKNNFTVEVNSQVYEKMPKITKQFLLGCNNKKIKFLKDNFDNFYSENNIDPQVKNDINKLIEGAEQYVFNELYVDYYDRYGQEVGRGPIKHKLKELITGEEIKEAVSAVIDDIEIPPTYFERVKTFFCGAGHANQHGC